MEEVACVGERLDEVLMHTDQAELASVSSGGLDRRRRW